MSPSPNALFVLENMKGLMDLGIVKENIESFVKDNSIEKEELLVLSDSGFNSSLSEFGEFDVGVIDSELIDYIPKIDNPSPSEYSVHGRLIPKNIKSYKHIIFLSNLEDSPTYKSLLINYSNSHKISLYSVLDHSIQDSPRSHNKFLMQRYNLIQKAKESETIGILLGTQFSTIDTEHKSQVSVIKDIMVRLIKNAGKKSY